MLCVLLSVAVAVAVYEPSRGASDHSTYLQNTSWKLDVLYLCRQSVTCDGDDDDEEEEDNEDNYSSYYF